MTTWPGLIATTDIDQDSPVTQPLMTTYRDQIESLAEADTSVPASLLPTVHLGTLNTTSGSTHTLSSLTLTPYRLLMAQFSSVGHNGSSETLSFAGVTVTNSFSSSQDHSGVIWISLSSGNGASLLGHVNNTNGIVVGLNTSISTATTSISVACTGTFNNGSVRFYGAK